jgi:alpha-L-fucosidase
MGNGWKSVAAGQAIGHQKIDRFAPVSMSRIRLNLFSSSQEAQIRELQVYSDAPANK